MSSPTPPRPLRPAVVILPALLLGLLVSWPLYEPSPTRLNPFDEAYYVTNGRLLLEGHCPALASNPGVALYWAVCSLPFWHSPAWMLHAAALGHLVLVPLFWWATARVGRAFGAPPWALGLLLLGAPVWASLLENSSDALYAAVAALALSQALGFQASGSTRSLTRASALAGMAALVRNDGLTLLPVLALLGASGPRTTRRVGAVALAVGPFVLVLSAFLVLASLSPEGARVGLSRRAYDAFEQGEGVVRARLWRGSNPFVRGYQEARALYGSGEEHGHSILRAVRRNPRAFARRVQASASQVPAIAMSAYGNGERAVGFLVLAFALRGAMALVAGGQLRTLLLGAAWWLSLGLYLVTFYREGYFLLASPLVLSLAARGLASMARPRMGRRERVAWTAGLLAMGVYEWAEGKWWFLPLNASVLLVIWWVGLHAQTLRAHLGERASGPLLAAALLLPLFTMNPLPEARHGHLPACAGTWDDLEAAGALAAALPQGSRVATYSLLAVNMARMTPVLVHQDAFAILSPDDLARWIQSQGVRAVLVDSLFQLMEPRLWNHVRAREGHELTLAFRSSSGHARMFLVKRPLDHGVPPPGLDTGSTSH